MTVTWKPGTYQAEQWQGPGTHPFVRPPANLGAGVAARFGVVELPSGYKQACEHGDWIVRTPAGTHLVLSPHEFGMLFNLEAAEIFA